MGASFISQVIRDTDSNKVREAFDSIVEDCLYEYGHNEYNGTFSTMSGLYITGKKFSNRAGAQDYLVNNTEKWGDAKAVIVEEDGKAPYTLIGGWAAE